jgi:hypothetical protein
MGSHAAETCRLFGGPIPDNGRVGCSMAVRVVDRGLDSGFAVDTAMSLAVVTTGWGPTLLSGSSRVTWLMSQLWAGKKRRRTGIRRVVVVVVVPVSDRIERDTLHWLGSVHDDDDDPFVCTGSRIGTVGNDDNDAAATPNDDEDSRCAKTCGSGAGLIMEESCWFQE